MKKKGTELGAPNVIPSRRVFIKGAAALGSPLHATAWLVRTLAGLGDLQGMQHAGQWLQPYRHLGWQPV